MKISMFRMIAAVFAAALLGLVCLNAQPKAGYAAAPLPVAQETPTEAPTATPAPTEMSPQPAMPPPTTGVPTYNGKPAGTNMLNDNPNGANWLSKFARNPGPDTSNMPNMGTRRHVIIIHHVQVHVHPTPHP